MLIHSCLVIYGRKEVKPFWVYSKCFFFVEELKTNNASYCFPENAICWISVNYTIQGQGIERNFPHPRVIEKRQVDWNSVPSFRYWSATHYGRSLQRALRSCWKMKIEVEQSRSTEFVTKIVYKEFQFYRHYRKVRKFFQYLMMWNWLYELLNLVINQVRHLNLAGITNNKMKQ